MQAGTAWNQQGGSNGARVEKAVSLVYCTRGTGAASVSDIWAFGRIGHWYQHSRPRLLRTLGNITTDFMASIRRRARLSWRTPWAYGERAGFDEGWLSVAAGAAIDQVEQSRWTRSRIGTLSVIRRSLRMDLLDGALCG